MTTPIEITVSRISGTDTGHVILIGPQSEIARYDFSLEDWSSDEDWQAIFWSLELYTQAPETWPTSLEIINRAEKLDLFSKGVPSKRRLESIGYKLYRTVFGSEEIRKLFSNLLEQVKNEIPLVQLRLQDKGSLLQTYPWELLHDGQDFLFDCHRALLVRRIDSAQASPEVTLKEPVKVLLLDPRPNMPPGYKKLPLLDRLYLQSLCERFRGKFEVKDLSVIPESGATLRKLRKYFMRFQNDMDILHIDVHGDFGWLCLRERCNTLNMPGSDNCRICKANRPEGEEVQGYLAFSIDDDLIWVSAEQLSKQLSDYKTSIQVVILSACKSGLIGGTSAFNSVAGALIKRGIPVVIAMQFSIDGYKIAEIFIDDFYEALISGKSLPEAMAEARKSLVAQSDDYWYRPVLYMRAEPDHFKNRVFVAELSEEERISTSFPVSLSAGTMQSASGFYIERPADDKCLEYLKSPYAVTLFVQAPKETGKSSLIHRVLDIARKEYNKKSVFIDLHGLSQDCFTDEKKFLIQLCLMISDNLDITEAIEEYWTGQRDSLSNCSRYLSQYIIPQIDEPFILAIDELEHLLTSPFGSDFFRLLRFWHNNRSSHNSKFAKMTLFLSSSTESSLFLSSPFNVAEPIILQDFTINEVNELNKRHNFPLNKEQVQDLMNFIGGHPYLTQLAFNLLVTRQMDIEAILTQAMRTGSPFEAYLETHCFASVRQKSELKQALMHIYRYGKCEESKIFYHLKGLGLIKQVGRRVVMRNNLYARYFEEQFSV